MSKRISITVKDKVAYQIQKISKIRGISISKLINLWIKEALERGDIIS